MSVSQLGAGELASLPQSSEQLTKDVLHPSFLCFMGREHEEGQGAIHVPSKSLARKKNTAQVFRSNLIIEILPIE